MNPLLTIGPPLPSCLRRPPVTPWLRWGPQIPRFPTSPTHASALCTTKTSCAPVNLPGVPAAAKPKGGRPPKSAVLRRDEWIRIRVNGLEKKAAEARAAAAGLDMSEYARLRICGAAPEQTAARLAEIERAEKSSQRAPGDRAAIVARIRREQPGLPERSVEILASRELARG